MLDLHQDLQEGLSPGYTCGLLGPSNDIHWRPAACRLDSTTGKMAETFVQLQEARCKNRQSLQNVV